MEPDYILTTDGGTRGGNPGIMYGSYEIRTRTGNSQIVRNAYYNGTSNEAEYLTLTSGLTDIMLRIRKSGKKAKSFSVLVKTDSKLVVNQIHGTYKVKKDQLKYYNDIVMAQLEQFGKWQVEWHPREESVKVLGH